MSKDTQVFYVHGFASTVKSDTLQKLQKFYPDAIGLTYDHTEPAKSIIQLTIQLQKYNDKNLVIVGSSLGGWYAEQLTKHIVADYILYNPCTEPHKSLAKYSVPSDVLNKYKVRETQCGPASRTVIISVDDPVIHAAIADNKYKNTADMHYTAGGHRMTEEAMDVIVQKINYLENQLP